MIEEIDEKKTKAKENPFGQKRKDCLFHPKDSKKSRSQRTYMPLRIEFDIQSVKELSFNWRKKGRDDTFPAYQ